MAWIIIVHLNTLINGASSSLRVRFTQINTLLWPESLLLHIFIILLSLCALYLCRANFAFRWCEEDGQSELNLHVTCENIIKRTFKRTEVWSLRSKTSRRNKKEIFSKGYKKSLRVLFFSTGRYIVLTSLQQAQTYLFCSVEDPIKRLNNSIFHHQRTWVALTWAIHLHCRRRRSCFAKREENRQRVHDNPRRNVKSWNL